MTLKILDLFSGIGGFSYAAERLVGGFETVAFCEIDPYCQKVLKKHWPDVPIHNDVRRLADEADGYRGLVDVVCGGYPCQGFSVAGDRKGQEDDRYLWPEMLRIIKAARPRFVIGENVAGHITLGLDTVLSDLAQQNYTARAFVIPACAKDAKHRRDRVWIVGHSEHYGSSSTEVTGSDAKDEGRSQKGQKQAKQSEGTSRSTSDAVLENTASIKCNTRPEKQASLREVQSNRGERNHSCGSSEAHTSNATNLNSQRLQGQRQKPSGVSKEQHDTRHPCWWEPEPRISRVAYGIPNRVDRIKSLGNSVVPQVVAEIFIAIKAMAND